MSLDSFQIGSEWLIVYLVSVEKNPVTGLNVQIPADYRECQDSVSLCWADSATMTW